MDQKQKQKQKLILTVLAVTTLVLIVVAASLFIFLPQEEAKSRISDQKPVEWAKPDIKEAPYPKENIKITEKKIVAPPVIQPSASADTVAKSKESKTETKSVKDANQSIIKTGETRKETSSTVKTVKSEAVSRQTVQTEKKSETKEVNNETAVSKNEGFWIQLGTFGSKENADNTAAVMKEKGYKTVIVNVKSNGKQVYKVRTGPYEDREKADKILSKIRKMNGFGDSYMTK